jgi:hypothetical protein
MLMGYTYPLFRVAILNSIGQHVISAAAVRQSGLEIISTGYMVIDGGAQPLFLISAMLKWSKLIKMKLPV